ncbi:uncharacterized protein LOC122439222 isoform X3 [Cervus canadensis]|uniref:uncharacterized protein LOC122439222 isoform X3 n=1 Tax=Cervus canadensis TaxID=1574408 RepID=UPI001C9E86DD|nr:uncharacterized protein LOC122439222 isoform X3 [Cervus canadensis]
MGRNLALSFCFCYCSFLPLLGRMVTKPSGFLAGLSLLLDSIFLPTGEARQSSGTQTRHSPRVLSQAAAGAQRKVLLRPDLVDPPTACAVRRGNAAGCRRKQAVPEQLLFSVSGWPSGLRRQTQGVSEGEVSAQSGPGQWRRGKVTMEPDLGQGGAELTHSCARSK